MPRWRTNVAEGAIVKSPILATCLSRKVLSLRARSTCCRREMGVTAGSVHPARYKLAIFDVTIGVRVFRHINLTPSTESNHTTLSRYLCRILCFGTLTVNLCGSEKYSECVGPTN